MKQLHNLLITCVTIFAFTSCSHNDEPYEIPTEPETPVGDEWIDPVFAKALEEKGYISNAETVTPAEVADITKINLDFYKNLQSLRGIESFTSLEQLDLAFNQLTEVDLSNNTELSWLDLGYNQLTSLNITKNTKLKFLSLRDNQLTTLDVTNNYELESLSCENNSIGAIDVSKNVKLRLFDCYSNSLTDIDVTKNIELEVLQCFNNELTALDVSQNKKLETLQCVYCKLTSLDISQNKELKSLFCYVNPGVNGVFNVYAWFDNYSIPTEITSSCTWLLEEPTWLFEDKEVTINFIQK